MQPPANTPVYESEIATYWWDESGILISSSKSPRRTIENVRNNLEVVKGITKGQKPCLLVYLTKSPVPDKATRQYVNGALPGAYKAMAIVSQGGLGAFVMNFLFALNAPPIPMKTFANDRQAKEWLKHYL